MCSERGVSWPAVVQRTRYIMGEDQLFVEQWQMKRRLTACVYGREGKAGQARPPPLASSGQRRSQGSAEGLKPFRIARRLAHVGAFLGWQLHKHQQLREELERHYTIIKCRLPKQGLVKAVGGL